MLKFLRKNTKAIIWTVVIAFIAWGAFAVSVQFNEAARAPGRIFGKEVSFRDYSLANRAVQIFSPPQGETPPDPERIESRTWEFLTLSHEAKRRKVEVSDEEVRQEIERLLGGEGGKGFVREYYYQWLRNAFRSEPREFENQVREHLRIRKLLEEIRQEAKENAEENLKRWLTELSARAQVEIYRPSA